MPNLVTKTDDQAARARWSHDQGLAITWEGGDDHALDATVDRLMSDEFRASARDGMAALPPSTGAREVAALLQGWTRR